MKFYSVMMVRNEADIWPGFISYHLKFFDKFLVVDHRSTDGTLEKSKALAAAGKPITIYEYRNPGYYQSEISNEMAREGFRLGADWVFFLDADEFLESRNRSTLAEALQKSPSDVVTFQWLNLIPTDPGDGAHFDMRQTFLSTGLRSRYGKVAISAEYARNNPDFDIHQGNHLVSPVNGAPPTSPDEIGRLFHVPIRSQKRLRRKLALGIQAYEAKHAASPAEGFHWYELYRRLEADSVDTNYLNGVIANYGEPLEQVVPIPSNSAELKRVTVDGDFNACDAVELGGVMAIPRSETAVALENTAILGNGPTTACLSNGMVRIVPRAVRATGEPGPRRFTPLTPGEGAPACLSWFDGLSTLADALHVAFEPIQAMVPSAWTRHAPLLMVLIAALRPRRYVEIGTHCGFSFFSACQAMEHQGVKGQCVAIDSWIGDHQAGFYDTQVFDDFIHLLKTRHPTGFYIRSLFDDARACFDDGSIDLLHIDGLHTFDAVRRDFENWLPTMSDRGVIMFHDTTVYEGDFGVWRLWKELEQKYPTFNLPHCHGLGLAYVGAQPSPVAALLRRLQIDDGLGVLVNSFFRNLGALIVSQAETVQNIELARAEAAQRVHAVTTEAEQRVHAVTTEAEQRVRAVTTEAHQNAATAQAEGERLHGRLQAVEAENLQLRHLQEVILNSISWRITKPLRKLWFLFKGA